MSELTTDVIPHSLAQFILLIYCYHNLFIFYFGLTWVYFDGVINNSLVLHILGTINTGAVSVTTIPNSCDADMASVYWQSLKPYV